MLGPCSLAAPPPAGLLGQGLEAQVLIRFWPDLPVNSHQAIGGVGMVDAVGQIRLLLSCRACRPDCVEMLLGGTRE
jgi:hypothetical protein